MNQNRMNTITISPQNSSVRDIELFTEALCDQIMINDTYFGNILTSLNELYLVWHNCDPSTPLKMSYSTDFLSLTVIVSGLNEEITEKLSTIEYLDNSDHSETNKGIFLIQHLSDYISISDDGNLEIAFDISAIHNAIYLERAQLLHAFFNRANKAKVETKNDHI